ncbi:MAG: dipeptidase [Candidatus Aminicenantes bacterium]|nr:dipeptidase [Candidatus Aminicenantes bacterium]
MKYNKTSFLPALLLILAAFAVAAIQTQDEAALEAKARDIHTRVLSVDTHCDTPGRMTRPGWDVGERHEPGLRESGQIDLPRMKEGCLDALFFGCFTGQGPLTEAGYANSKARAIAQIDAVEAMTAKYPGLVGKATTPADAARLKKEGKLSAFIGVENGYPIGDDLSMVEALAKRGVRYITLCHSSDNQICDSSTDRRAPEDMGLSEFGKKVVAECNRLGIMVDVSHMSDKSFADVIKASKAPVIASHSCCRELCDNPRNLNDGMIKALAANGGVLQMCFLSGYLVPPQANPERDAARKALEEKYGTFETMDPAKRNEAMAAFRELSRKYPDTQAKVKDIVDHIDHIVKLVGIDYVGIGTDFDGGGGVEDCNDVSRMYRVTMELLRRGYTEPQIQKIWGGNIMRVLQKVIDIAG